jgi:hypothetical protein
LASQSRNVSYQSELSRDFSPLRFILLIVKERKRWRGMKKETQQFYLCCRNLRPCLHACAYKGGVSVYSFQSQLFKSAKKRRKRYDSGIALITYLLTAISLRKVRVLESTSFLFVHNQPTAWPNDEILGTSGALCDRLRDCCAAADGWAVRT